MLSGLERTRRILTVDPYPCLSRGKIAEKGSRQPIPTLSAPRAQGWTPSEDSYRSESQFDRNRSFLDLKKALKKDKKTRCFELTDFFHTV